MDALQQPYESTTVNPTVLNNNPELPFGNDLPFYFSDATWQGDTLDPLWITTSGPMLMGLLTSVNEASFPPLDTNKAHSPGESISPPGVEIPKASASSEDSVSIPHSDSGVFCMEVKTREPRKPSQRSSKKTAARARRRHAGDSSSVSSAEPRRGTAVVNKSPDDSKNMPVADIEDNEVVDDDDKSQLRARNRKAAAKFRVRKKGDARKLREREEASRELNRILTHEVGKLREECLMLKNMVLDYARCGCPPIDDYIQNAAAGAWKASNPSNKNVP